MAGKDIWSGQEDIPCMVKKGVKKKKVESITPKTI